MLCVGITAIFVTVVNESIIIPVTVRVQ